MHGQAVPGAGVQAPAPLQGSIQGMVRWRRLFMLLHPGVLPTARAGKQASAGAGHSRAEGLLLPAGRGAGSSACVAMTQPAASLPMSV